MRTRTFLIAAVATSALLLASCGSSSDGGDAKADKTTTTAADDKGTDTTEVEVPKDAVETDQVEIADTAFSPTVIKVKPGTTVTWTNNDDKPHTVTADDGSFDTGTISPGDTMALSFDKEGVYPYHCEIHSSMTATVVVAS